MPCASPDVFDGGARIVEGVALVAHLRGDFGLFCALGHFASFFDRPGERLLHVDVFVKIHGRKSDGSVHVIGGGDENGVNILLLFEHPAIVLVAFGFWEMLVFEPDHIVQPRFGFRGIERRLRLARGWR